MTIIGNSKNINYIWANLIIEELVRQGVLYFCISPGSRSSALAMAAEENPRAKTFVHFDERGLAFHALGFASASGQTVALICTSGTAAANFFPAIIETSKKKLPLVVLTADRPPELRYTGAMQTIDQVHLFGRYTKWFVDMPCPTQEIKPEMVLTTIDQAVYQASSGMHGVVHLNCMFREPLAPLSDKINAKEYLSSLTDWLKSDLPFTTYSKDKPLGLPSEIFKIAELINQSSKGIIVCGKLSSEYDREAVLNLAQKLHWPICADVTSGLRLGNSHLHVVHYFDQMLCSSKGQRLLNSDCVLHFGGRITSKRWYQFVEKIKPKQYVMVLNHSLRNDPLHCVTYRVESKPGDFIENLSELIDERAASKRIESIINLNNLVSKIIQKSMDQKQSLEAGIARTITQMMPEGEGLFLSNSMSVRLVDMYGDNESNSISVGGNRGANGIDGVIASAIGFSKGLDKRVTLLIGDLATLYDLNSLAMLKKYKKPFILVVLNNDGGEIFRHLPIASQNSHFTKLFQTPHGLTFKEAARMFGLAYALTSSLTGFSQMYQKALRGNKSVLFEIKTNAGQSVNFQKKLKENISKV